MSTQGADEKSGNDTEKSPRATPRERATRERTHQDQVHPIVYPITRFFVSAYFRAGGLRVFGQDNIPQSGRFILSSNHVSHLDPPLISHVCPRTPHIIAKAELFKNPIFGAYIARLGAFPVKRGQADRKAIRRAIEVLESEKGLIIFPEGGRSRDGEIGEAEIGFAMIAHSAKAPVVPTYLKGTEQALSAVRPGIRMVKTEVHYGQPLLFEEEYSRRADRQTLQAIGARVMEEIKALRERAQS